MHRNIPIMITGICQSLGIDYKSSHLLESDISRLQEIAWELDSFSNEIDCICERHNVNGNNEILQRDIEAIRNIEHDLRDVAQKIKMRKR